MTRKIVLLFIAAALALSGCKKLQTVHWPWKKSGPAVTAAATPSNPAATPAPPPPPSNPDITAVPETTPGPTAPTATATPSTPATPGVPAGSPKAAIDQNASAIALCYHNIEDNSKMKALTITVAEFEKEMKAIKDNGFTVIPLQDFIAWRRGEKNIAHKSCIISIDDGWVSGYNNAWPILKKYGYPFTLFIYINYVGTGGKSMAWAQLEEMRDAGVDIECHTYSHSNLHGKGLNLAKGVPAEIASLGYEGWLKKELIDSKQVLEKQLGIKVDALAYPYGIYNSKVLDVEKQAGYEAAFTVYGQRLTHSSPSNLLGRYAVEAGKPKIFQDAMAMIGGGVSAAEAVAPAMTQLAAASMVTEPMDNATINNPLPRLKANLSTMGEVEPGSTDLRLSGVGAIPAQYNAETKMLTAQVTQKLRPGNYTAIISAKVNGQKVETRWSFKFDPAAKPSSPADAPLPPASVLGR